MADLKIENLHVAAGDKQILKGVDLHVRSGEIHAMMGPNGSGKSTLANAIMGHPGLEVTQRGTPVDLDTARGAIRLRRRASE